ncbi:MAG: hypothetical protein LBU94_06140 [Clostridiales bacterium]|jgi:hypothetical protein|nr:hypothetical protein [Clostridiales bacterium]
MVAILDKSEITAAVFMPTTVLSGMKENPVNLMMFASFSMIIVLLVIFMAISMSSADNYTSDLERVTDYIYIPKAVGQQQHGSARFMRADEYDKAFDSLELTGNPIFESWLVYGTDNKEVMADSQYYKDILLEIEKTQAETPGVKKSRACSR